MKFGTSSTLLSFLAAFFLLFGAVSSFTLVVPPLKKCQYQSQQQQQQLSGVKKSLPILSATVQDEDGYDYARISRRRQRRREVYEQADGIFDDDDDDEFVDDEEWDDDDDDDDDEEYGLFSNVLIDNPLLDQMDPDGAAERFPELASDPKFWIDMVLFICFLDFLSVVGPQNYYPEGTPYF